MKVDFDAVFSV